MLLFHDRYRGDARPVRAAESTYQFIDRVHDAAFGRVRDVLNEWTGRFGALQTPEATRDLVGRLRSKQNQQFDAAFWELYLHELHVRLGYDVTVHPESECGSRPDFWISRDGRAFYLEAVAPAPEPGAPRSVEAVLEHVDAAYHPDFFLKLRFVILAEQIPRRREVIDAVNSWLQSLDWSDWWRGTLDVAIPYPETVVEVRGWRIGLQALPRAPEARRTAGEGVRMIGIRSGPAGVLGDGGAGAALDDKANKYGDLDAPFVIALWLGSPLASPVAVGETLFGLELPDELGVQPTNLPLNVPRDGLLDPKPPKPAPSLWCAERDPVGIQRGRRSACHATPLVQPVG